MVQNATFEKLSLALATQVGGLKRHRMREPGSDGNFNVTLFQKFSDNMLNDPPY